jgi:hypothetical protein
MDRSTIEVDGKQMNLSTGMAVTVEIKTGQRSPGPPGRCSPSIRLLVLFFPSHLLPKKIYRWR